MHCTDQWALAHVQILKRGKDQWLPLPITVPRISARMDENRPRSATDLGSTTVPDCCTKLSLNRWYNDHRRRERGYDTWNHPTRTFRNTNNEVHTVGVHHLHGRLSLAALRQLAMLLNPCPATWLNFGRKPYLSPFHFLTYIFTHVGGAILTLESILGVETRVIVGQVPTSVKEAETVK